MTVQNAFRLYRTYWRHCHSSSSSSLHGLGESPFPASSIVVSLSIVFLVYLCLVSRMVDMYMPVVECGYVPFFADVLSIYSCILLFFSLIFVYNSLHYFYSQRLFHFCKTLVVEVIEIALFQWGSHLCVVCHYCCREQTCQTPILRSTSLA
jgi:hypothetical protein